jgi:hypothetical protein
MKLLQTILKGTTNLLFIDFEGTQFSHEIIAIGAVLVKCDEECVPICPPKTFKCYIKSKSKIGSLVTNMTGIDKDLLENQGISFLDSMKQLNDFLGEDSKDLKVLTYGNQDIRMLMSSLRHTIDDNEEDEFLKSFVLYLKRNTVDMGAFFSRYIRGKKNELISLVKLRDYFGIEPSGSSHDPLVDSLDLYHIYLAFTTDKELIISSYKRILRVSNIVPDPIKHIIISLLNENTVTPEDFDKLLETYFE